MLYVHRNRRLIRDGSRNGHLDFHTAPEFLSDGRHVRLWGGGVEGLRVWVGVGLSSLHTESPALSQSAVHTVVPLFNVTLKPCQASVQHYRGVALLRRVAYAEPGMESIIRVSWSLPSISNRRIKNYFCRLRLGETGVLVICVCVCVCVCVCACMLVCAWRVCTYVCVSRARECASRTCAFDDFLND